MPQSDRNGRAPSRARTDHYTGDGEIKTRVWRRPRTGTKVTILVGLSLLACAVYFLFAPVYMDTASGWFGCGNFIQGSEEEFVQEVCKGAPDRYGALAMLSGALAVIIGVLGSVLFGFDMKVEHRRFPQSQRNDQSKGPSRDDLFVRDRGASRSRDEDDLPTRSRRGSREMWDE